MNKLLKKILSKFKSSTTDELHGKWHSEDGTGFAMIMGCSIQFNPDGTGAYESSGTTDQAPYSYSGMFNWRRLEKDKIVITTIENSKEELVHYKVENSNGRQELKNVTNGTENCPLEEFWNLAQVVFRME
jgi:hypothetical protein